MQPNCIFLNDISITKCDTCQLGYLQTTINKICKPLINSCISLNDIFFFKCDQCFSGYIWKDDTSECIPSNFNGCLFYYIENGQYKCKLCSKTLRLTLINETAGCRCMDGFRKNMTC
jgi:hypothetical protein